MSAQVNYWLQKLNFYPAVAGYVTSAKPKLMGVNHTPAYEQCINELKPAGQT